MVLEFYSVLATKLDNTSYSSRSLVCITDKLLQWTIIGYRNSSATVNNLQSTTCWAQFIFQVLKKKLNYPWFIKKKSSVFQATTEPQIVRKTSRRQVECWQSFLACRHIPYLSNYVSFTALVEVGVEPCEETWVTRKSNTASAEVTHLCVPKCKTFYVKTAPRWPTYGYRIVRR
jgi:hypothetical protein